ncbi:actin-like ATPase domain-containing protein [Auricularia subglabra TFB-10046 SS5]|nr:actin-like ATPase domain-containing protein [Auricularia subglabra TFB-10046 SS5]
MAASQPQPNGASAGSKTVIGINFGDSYASIAVLSNEKTAECIANENGERQIACAVSYNGEETYIGNQALPQLVKNARNTITGFRNLLGKKFSDVSEQYTNTTSSAPVIKHPDSDLPAYSVEILVPVPKRPEPAAIASLRGTPAASAQPTPAPSPPPEPQRLTKILSVPEVTTLFLRSLLQSATDYLGTRVDGAVLAVPTWFSPEARAALTEAAEAAGIHVLQLLDEPGAAALLLPQDTDQTVLVLDAGASGVSLALLALRAGLAHVLGSSTTPGCGAKAIDDRLVAFFAKEFTKKTKTPLVLPAQNEEDARAERKLRLAVDATKRTLSAGVGGAAACSVESLKAGLDLAGSINRLRFDLEVAPVYRAIAGAVHALLKERGLEPLNVDAVLLVGGSARLPGLIAQLEALFPESTAISHAVDPTEVLARGAALAADADVDLDAREAKTTCAERTIGIYFPGGGASEELSATNFVPLVAPGTPLPARRSVAFPVAKDADRVGFEVVEARQEVYHPPAPQRPAKEVKEGEEDEDEEDEDEEEAPEPELRTHKEGVLGALVLGVSAKEKVVVEVVVSVDGAVSVAAWQEGGERTTLVVPAP